MKNKYKIFISFLTVVALFLVSPSSSSEEICWRDSAELSPHWISIEGIPAYSTPVSLNENHMSRSFVFDRCIEAEIPHVLCMSKLSPLLKNLLDARYREDCRFDMNYDSLITMADLALAIVHIQSNLNTVCSP